MERKSGVLMHISSLFGDHSIGSLGEEAKYFIDFLAACDFSYWQVLPFCPVDAYNSPYKSYSTFGGNPYFVDLNTLYEKELITEEELVASKQKTPYLAEFDRLRLERLPLLKKAMQRVTDWTAIEKFINSSPYLLSFCEFMAQKAANQDLPWYAWDKEKTDWDTFRLWQFVQYEFFMQWATIKAYAGQKGIRIMGDMPMYVSLDSCDVWRNPTQYCLDANGRPVVLAGVPPDYFQKDGQLWGNPLYNWAAMKQDGYRWWRDRICHYGTLFDAIRIDHFRAVESYWAVPFGAETAKEGHWEKGPGMAFVRAVRDAAGEAQLIAENLGDITPAVEALVKDSGFAGMRVFQFGFFVGAG